jgi:hypothetical protein
MGLGARGNPIQGLYPQPPQSALGGNPLQMIPLMIELQQNQRAQQLFNAQGAAGRALTGSMGPSGFDYNKALANAGSVPGIAGSQYTQDATAMRGQNIQQGTALIQQGAAAGQVALGDLAALQGQKNLNQTAFLGAIARSAVRNPNIPANVWQSVAAGFPPDSAGQDAQRAYLAQLGISAAGPATGAEMVPTTTPGGQSGVVPKAQAVQGQGGGFTPQGLGPGMQAFQADQQTSSTMAGNMRSLTMALPMIEQMGGENFGPQTANYSKIRNGLIQAGIIAPDATDAQASDEVNKLLNRYSGMSRSAGRSDEGLHQSLVSSPNTMASKPGILGQTKNQIALDRMDIAMPQIYAMQHPEDGYKNNYLGFKSSFYNNYDEKAFNFDLLTPQERASVMKGLGPKSTPDKPNPAYDKFINSLRDARQVGAVAAPAGQ